MAKLRRFGVTQGLLRKTDVVQTAGSQWLAVGGLPAFVLETVFVSRRATMTPRSSRIQTTKWIGIWLWRHVCDKINLMHAYSSTGQPWDGCGQAFHVLSGHEASYTVTLSAPTEIRLQTDLPALSWHRVACSLLEIETGALGLRTRQLGFPCAVRAPKGCQPSS